MSFVAAVFIACAVGTLILIWLSREPEYRDQRWPKIAGSQPFFICLAAFFTVFDWVPATPFFMGGCIITLWLIWRDELAHLGAKGLMGVLYGDGRGGGGFVPTFGFAQSLINEDRLKDAETEILEQLAKEPHNFEGNRMLAAIYQEWEQPEKAIAALDEALLNPDIPDSQIEFIKEAIKQLEEQQERLIEKTK